MLSYLLMLAVAPPACLCEGDFGTVLWLSFDQILVTGEGYNHLSLLINLELTLRRT